MTSAAGPVGRALLRGTPSRAAVTLEALRAAARASKGSRSGPHCSRSPALASRLGVPVAAQVRAPAAGRSLQDPRCVYRDLPDSRRPARSRRHHLLQRQSWPGGGLRRAAAGDPRGGGHAGAGPRDQSRGSQALGGEVVIAGNSSAERYAHGPGPWPRSRASPWCRRSRAWMSLPARAPAGWRSWRSAPTSRPYWSRSGGGGLIAGIACGGRGAQAIGPGRSGSSRLALPSWPGRSRRAEPVKLDQHREPGRRSAPPVHRRPSLRRSRRAGARSRSRSRRTRSRRRFAFSTMRCSSSVEPSGAVTTAALLSGRVQPTGPDRRDSQRRQRRSRPVPAPGAAE